MSKEKRKKQSKVKLGKLEAREARVGYLFVLPWVIGTILFLLYPLCQSFYYMWFNIRITPLETKFIYVGTGNFTQIWLENPEFGNLMEDIREFSEADKIITVHFRNVSGPLPVFEETLVEDGYADMISVMEQLVRCQCCANISIDHAFFRPGEKHMSETSRAYMTGYLKGMLHTVQARAADAEKPD